MTTAAGSAAASSYDAELARGLRLTGDTREVFSQRRVTFLATRLARRGISPGSVLDFGCGTGETARHLAAAFPQAEVMGADAAPDMVAEAGRRFPGAGIRFEETASPEVERRRFELIYAANVLHHVPPAERRDVLARLKALLAPGGVVAIFENNPWNPGTRAVMARIAFDRGVAPLSPRELARRLDDAGLRRLEARSLFYFPRWLRWLRPLEAPLARLPLGGQTYALARPAEAS